MFNMFMFGHKVQPRVKSLHHHREAVSLALFVQSQMVMLDRTGAKCLQSTLRLEERGLQSVSSSSDQRSADRTASTNIFLMSISDGSVNADWGTS